jgi:hypothetical protein
LRYWDGTGWQDSWTGGDLPGAVEISLGASPMMEEGQDAEYEGELFRRIVHLPAGIRAQLGGRARGLGRGGRQ